MKNLFLAAVFIMLSTLAYGQRDSILKEIMDYNNSKSVIISKARSLLLDKFMEDDFVKMKEIKNYLISEVDNDDYAVFYPIEYWLILYWTQEYTEIIGSISRFDSVEIASLSKKIKPQNDDLFEKVRSRSRESRSFLISAVRNSGLSNHDRDFLIMNLDYLIAGKDYPDITQEDLNRQADNFLEKYPGSDLEGYTRKYIRLKYVASKWGLGFEFFSGYGLFTDELTDSFTNNVPFGVAFDIYYRNFVLYLRDYIGFSRTSRDILYSDGTWAKGSQVRIFLPEASLGYILADMKAVRIAPFLGIGGTGISPTEHDTEQDPNLEKAELGFTTVWSFGLNLDLRVGRSRGPLVSYGMEQGGWFIRLRYAYNIIGFDRKYDGFAGNMHYLTIGLGGFGHRMKRAL